MRGRIFAFKNGFMKTILTIITGIVLLISLTQNVALAADTVENIQGSTAVPTDARVQNQFKINGDIATYSGKSTLNTTEGDYTEYLYTGTSGNKYIIAKDPVTRNWVVTTNPPKNRLDEFKTSQDGFFTSITSENAKGEKQPQKAEEIWCIKGGITTGIDISMTGCAAKVAYIFLFFASWVLWLAAVVFNLTIDYSLNMAGFLEKVDMVTIGWKTFRDFANLFFIFVILYIAINTILGNSSYGIKSLLGKVIVAAILINFSLFFTKVVIDASNIFALQFYTKIIHDSGGKAGQFDSWQEYDGGISAALASAMGMETVWRTGRSAQNSSGDKELTTDSAKELGLNAGNLIIVGFGGGVFILITAAVFLAGALMFFLRAITLIFLMILSPFAFVGGVLPATKGYALKWRDKLFQNAIFAPVYMALMYLVLSMVLDGGKLRGGDFVQIFSGDTGSMETIITFIILNALMIGCITIAKQLGAQGAGFASKILATTGTLAGATTFGAAALAGRNTLGRMANAYANSDMAKGASNAFTRSFTRLSNKVANGSFDARQIGGMGKKLGIGTGDGKNLRQINDEKKKAIIEDSKIFNDKGKMALARSMQGKWSKAKNDAGDDILKTAIADETAKEREAMQEYRDDPDYKEALRLISKSGSKDGLTAKEMQRMHELKQKYDKMGEVEEKTFIDDIANEKHGQWIKTGKKTKILDFSSHAPGKWSLTSDYIHQHGESGRNAAKYNRRKLYSESGRSKFTKGNLTL